VTGFIRGIFRSKPKADVEPQQASTPQPKPQPKPKAQPRPKTKAEAYYLSSDDAKTYGDIDFMRMAKQTRRTFPKAKFGAENEFIQSLSSVEKSNGTPIVIAPPSASKTAASPETNDRRRTDTSMDMFRNMAKEIRKR
jgi:hypothetical protein